MTPTSSSYRKIGRSNQDAISDHRCAAHSNNGTAEEADPKRQAATMAEGLVKTKHRTTLMRHAESETLGTIQHPRTQDGVA